MAEEPDAPGTTIRSGAAQKLVAISYARVSTPNQATDDASGIERQELAIQEWLQRHPDYELDREIRHIGSGAKAGRFEWFIEELQQGRLPQGTCLVVEKMSRLGREQLEDTFETLIRIFKAGGALAVCSLAGGQVLRSLSSQQGAVYQLAGAIDAARVEWEERRDRKLGSDARKRRLIAEGAKPFKARGKGARHASYPFWLDFDERSGQFKTNSHAEWVHNIFLWAQEVGAVEIARRLKEHGHRLPTSPKNVISSSRVTTLLRNRAVLGERQHYSKRKPTGGPVPGVYPPIVTADEWRLAWDAIQRRNSRRGAIAHRRMHIVFEGRIFCLHCQGRIGYCTSSERLANGEKRTYYYLRCNAADKNRARCQAPHRPYDEERLLQRMQCFRWAAYFSDRRHDAEVSAARKRVLVAEGKVADVERTIQTLHQAEDDFIAKGRAWPLRLEDRRQDAERSLVEAECDRNLARAALESLQRRRTGKDAQKAIQGRITAFMTSDRTDLNNRQQFNRWLFAENLVIAYDLDRNTFELGTGKVSTQGQLVELDQRLEDAAAFGMDVEQVRRELAGRDQARVDVRQESVQNGREGATSSIVISKSQQRPTSSAWPQPEKAWGHVDREPLRRIAEKLSQT
jgi:DNA invertase Pin-like site-specific DNA recombinase